MENKQYLKNSIAIDILGKNHPALAPEVFDLSVKDFKEYLALNKEIILKKKPKQTSWLKEIVQKSEAAIAKETQAYEDALDNIRTEAYAAFADIYCIDNMEDRVDLQGMLDNASYQHESILETYLEALIAKI